MIQAEAAITAGLSYYTVDAESKPTLLAACVRRGNTMISIDLLNVSLFNDNLMVSGENCDIVMLLPNEEALDCYQQSMVEDAAFRKI